MPESPEARGDLRGGRGRLPEAVGAEEGVGEGDELAHDGDEGHHGQLAALAEALVEGRQGRVAADRGERGHVGDATRLGAPAADMAAAFMRAAVTRAGSHPEQGPGRRARAWRPAGRPRWPGRHPGSSAALRPAGARLGS